MPHKIAPHLSLYEQARHRELVRHEGRLANIKLARAKLEMLDEYAEGLKAAGAPLWAEEIELMRAHLGEGKKAMHVLRISFFETGDHIYGNKARAFLLAQGFRETINHRYPTWATVTLSKGHLHLCFHVGAIALATAQATPATTA